MNSSISKIRVFTSRTLSQTLNLASFLLLLPRHIGHRKFATLSVHLCYAGRFYRKRNVTVWCPSVRLSVCPSFSDLHTARGAHSTWPTRGSTRHGQRTFPSVPSVPSEYYDYEHTCLQLAADTVVRSGLDGGVRQREGRVVYRTRSTSGYVVPLHRSRAELSRPVAAESRHRSRQDSRSDLYSVKGTSPGLKVGWIMWTRVQNSRGNLRIIKTFIVTLVYVQSNLT